MGIIHDKIADKVTEFFIREKTFGNRYKSTNIPLFPKPDIILLGLSKDPKPQIAFEVKPPHAVKREYLTGLGQATSYLMTFPLIYVVLPDETIDAIHIPTFISEIIEKSGLKVGVIAYDIQDYIPKIIKKAILEENIDIKKLEKRITSLRPRSWVFWMDTSLEEVGLMLALTNKYETKNLEGDFRSEILDELWDENLSKRNPNAKKPSSFKLNYQLLFDTLNIWTGNGKLTVLGNRLYEICKKYGFETSEFKDAFHYVILTEGGYLNILTLINKFQIQEDFHNKGTVQDLNKTIRKIRNELKIKAIDYEQEKEKVLPLYEKRADNCWIKVMVVNIFKLGYGRSLTQLNEEMNRRFSPYFQKQLKTNFFLNDVYIKKKGYIINWERILDLVDKGDKNLNIF